VGTPGVLRESGDQAGAGQQVQIAGQGGRVARLVQLPEHLVVREDLSGILRPEAEQLLEEEGLVHPLQRENVAFDVGLDHGPEYEAPPPGLIANEGRRTRVAAEVEVAVEIEVEGRRHLGERPVGELQDLVAPSQALGQPALHEERSRTQQDDVERETCEPVLVPESLHRLGPVRDLLDLVERQDEAPPGGLGCETRLFPLADEPASVPSIGRG